MDFSSTKQQDRVDKAQLLSLPRVIVIDQITITLTPDGEATPIVKPPTPYIKVEYVPSGIVTVSATCPATVYFNGETYESLKGGDLFKRKVYMGEATLFYSDYDVN